MIKLEKFEITGIKSSEIIWVTLWMYQIGDL